MAARCAPRAMKVTSAPALASAAPNPPPTPPAPTTAIRMKFFPLCCAGDQQPSLRAAYSRLDRELEAQSVVLRQFVLLLSTAQHRRAGRAIGDVRAGGQMQ